ncbi:MAG: peptidoglycan bridge formation glycyltransferase FemA/FemB family protein [Candidatus Spechtbacterales bacterium]|nr:peptidoglycan bridge formation glycyltransferase FemA/FemB family protein [Candidatus Spechtbacterales bacterium]
MSIKEIKNEQEWDGFITAQDEHTFLQSWAWGELNKELGDKIFRIGIYKNKKIVAAILIIKVNARRGNFLFIPHGPVVNKDLDISMYEVIEELTNELRNIAKKEKDVVFIRISPLMKDMPENKKIFQNFGYMDAPIYMHAETTWQVDLNRKEKEIMMDMRKNTRNLIRRAGREGVEVISGTGEDLTEEFLKLYKETAKAQGFVPFSDKYIKKEIEKFRGDAKIYLAKWKGKVLSTALIPAYGDSAFYHHGANSAKHRKIPASYALQWQAIRDAKEEGRAHYNFWGIAKDTEDKNHPWYGLSLFKRGFGGYRKDYLHAQDLPLKWTYVVNYVVEKIRLIKRGV